MNVLIFEYGSVPTHGVGSMPPDILSRDIPPHIGTVILESFLDSYNRMTTLGYWFFFPPYPAIFLDYLDLLVGFYGVNNLSNSLSNLSNYLSKNLIVSSIYSYIQYLELLSDSEPFN